jgi:hypothetical protein
MMVLDGGNLEQKLHSIEKKIDAGKNIFKVDE